MLQILKECREEFLLFLLARQCQKGSATWWLHPCNHQSAKENILSAMTHHYFQSPYSFCRTGILYSQSRLDSRALWPANFVVQQQIYLFWGLKCSFWESRSASSSIWLCLRTNLQRRISPTHLELYRLQSLQVIWPGPCRVCHPNLHNNTLEESEQLF